VDARRVVVVFLERLPEDLDHVARVPVHAVEINEGECHPEHMYVEDTDTDGGRSGRIVL
jgi:hypothetical protein